MRKEVINGITTLYAGDGMVIRSKVWPEMEAEIVELAEGDTEENYYEEEFLQDSTLQFTK